MRREEEKVHLFQLKYGQKIETFLVLMLISVFLLGGSNTKWCVCAESHPCVCLLAVHGARQEEVIDHRLTDREWAEEWKHLDNVRISRRPSLMLTTSFFYS